MQFLSFTTALVSMAVAVSGASLETRDDQCSLKLGYNRTQNPVVGGDNTYSCWAELTYANGDVVTLSTACNEVTKDHCYSSNLPYQICVHTQNDLTEGYVDYSDTHIDFNGEGSCAGTKDVGIGGEGRTQTCAFAC